jgi:hypothetical protein
MALDFCILSKEGYPTDTVEIGVDLHHSLIEIVLQKNLTLFKRITDYYEDADFIPSEMNALSVEIKQILETSCITKELINSLLELLHLINKAQQKGCGLSVIAD